MKPLESSMKCLNFDLFGDNLINKCNSATYERDVTLNISMRIWTGGNIRFIIHNNLYNCITLNHFENAWKLV